MFIQILLLVVGFILLIKGADIFVDGASSTAQNFKLSKMLIGLTIVAFGTSAPEFAVSIHAMLDGSGEMVLGNVVGSNIINTLLILGIASVICPLRVKNNTVKKELPISLLISALLVVVFLDSTFDIGVINQITRSDGIVIILFFMVFVYYLISTMRNKVDDDMEEKPKYGMKKSILFTVLGLFAIMVGSDMVVNSATFIAGKLGISERIISLTVIALGTSLPELVTSITAALKKEQDILIGNIIGSNIFNICIVLGVPVALLGGIVPSTFANLDLYMLFISAAILFFFSQNDHKISRREGMFMIATFVVYYGYIFVQGVIL